MLPCKVLHVLNVEKEAFFFSNLCEATDRARVTMSFATFAADGPFTQRMRERQVSVHALGSIDPTHLGGIEKLRRVIREENPDIVHGHLFWPSMVGLSLAKLTGRKTVITRHHSDALHQIRSPWKRQLYLRLENRLSAMADHIVAPSRAVRHYLVDVEGVSADKVSVIPYGQTRQRFDAVTADVVAKTRAELQLDGTLSLVCVSRLFDRKGHQFLFEALAPLVKAGLRCKLLLVGSGDYQAELERQVAELGLGQTVQFLGFRTDALNVIGAADILVHPSLEDALSQALIEGLMLGRPIIATDISGAADTLDGGKYGRLVPPADATALRTALTETIADLDAARAQAAAGRRHLLDYMNAEKVASQYTAIYERLLGR